LPDAKRLTTGLGKKSLNGIEYWESRRVSNKNRENHHFPKGEWPTHRWKNWEKFHQGFGEGEDEGEIVPLYIGRRMAEGGKTEDIWKGDE